MATFLLVHGTSCGGWVWQKLAPLLRASGHEVYTPTLSGVSDRAHLLSCQVDLTTHITDITSLIENEDLSEVVLVGHSYAGMVITGAAAKIPERLSQVVYLDAYLPDEGQTEADLWPADMRAEILAGASAGSGVRQPPSASFLGIADPELAGWVQKRLTPHPLACYLQPANIGKSRDSSIQFSYIHCTIGNTVSIFNTFSTKAEALGWKVYKLPTGHMVMLTLPQELSMILKGLVDHSKQG